MASNLYEVLGVSTGKDASPEEIRKAYRKRALQTHPDRLPQNVSPEDKKAAEEQFRLVNNAYEVLNNADNRKLYDHHGVWPPPTEQAGPSREQPFGHFAGDPFANDPFFAFPGRFPRSHHQFVFTDPFELFRSIFGDLHLAFENDPFFANTPFVRSPFDDPFFRNSMFGSSPFSASPSPFGHSNDPFGGMMLGGSPFNGLMGGSMFPAIGHTPSNANARMYSSSTRTVGQNGQWVSHSQMTRTVNGRTEVITKRVDSSGNEHVTYSSPEGERYTINGVEQPAQHAIADQRRSESDRPSRVPPPMIADRPANPPVNYAPPPPRTEAYNVPIAGSSNSHRHTQSHPQSQVPPAVPSPVFPSPQNIIPERHSSRHGHREREQSRHEPHRGHTMPYPTAPPPANVVVPERRHSSHVPDPVVPMPGAYYTHQDSAHRGMREQEQEPHDSRHHKEHRTSRDRRDAQPAMSRNGSLREDNAPREPSKEHHRGWRGWFSSVFRPFRHRDPAQHQSL